MGLGPSPQYLAQYNSYVLPGYVQNEVFSSDMTVAQHYAPYADGSPSEYVGLQNKMLQLRLKVWEQDFATCKEQVQLAATYLRTKRNGFADLYIQDSDRHYEAMVKSIREENTAGKSVRIMEYEVQFETRPWLISNDTFTLSGIGTINTDQVSRDLYDGGWTPATITLTGTDITISGYTSTGDFAGYVEIDGAVSNLIIDSENYTATIGGVNANAQMITADYRLFVGPGRTNFAITGASTCTIDYQNRWYL